MKIRERVGARAVRIMIACCALISAFTAGAFMATGNSHAPVAFADQADQQHVYELMIYHTMPGKVPELEGIFRSLVPMMAKYNVKVIGYWVPNEDPQWKDTFIYVVDHPSRQAADANWKALHTDPAFLPYRKAAEPLIARVNGDFNVDEIYMRPTDFSALK